MGIGVAVLGLLGCQAIESMDEMREKTASLEQKTSHVQDRSEDIYVDGREGYFGDKAPQFMRNLREHRWIHDKLFDAADYVFAFEFQHWGNHWGDNQAMRDVLIDKGLKAFFVQIFDMFSYANRTPFGYSFSVNPTLPPNNTWKSLGALSYAIGLNDELHVKAAKERGFKALSFYDLITMALRMKYKPQKGETAPYWVKKVYRFEDRAVELLQLRHNFLALMVLGHVDNFDKNPIAQARMRFAYWEFPFDSFNNEMLEDLITYLRESEQTRDFLRSVMGLKIEWYETMRAVYENAVFVSVKNPVAAKILNNQQKVTTPFPRGSREALAVELRDLWAKIAVVSGRPESAQNEWDASSGYAYGP